jgi:hypothetical protein
MGTMLGMEPEIIKMTPVIRERQRLGLERDPHWPSLLSSDGLSLRWVCARLRLIGKNRRRGPGKHQGCYAGLPRYACR